MEFHRGKIGQQNLGVFFQLESTRGRPLRTDGHVSSDWRGNINASTNEAWATKLSEVWSPMTFIDKYDITGRPVQFPWHIFPGHTAIQIMREVQTFLGTTIPFGLMRESYFMSTLNIGKTCEKCLANEADVTEYAKQIKLGHWCCCGPGHRKVWYRSCSNKTKRSMGSYCQEHDTEVWRSFTSNILLCWTFPERRSQVQEGQADHSLSVYDSDKDNHCSYYFGMQSVMHLRRSVCLVGSLQSKSRS